MADAAQARSIFASRNDEIRLVKPELQDLRIPADGGMQPLMHVDEPEIVLDQAFSLLMLVREGWRTSRQMPSECGVGFGELNDSLHAHAIEGISTLVALASHGVALMRFEREGRSND